MEFQEYNDQAFASLVKELCVEPNMGVSRRLYRPDIEYEALPDVEAEEDVHRIKVGGVVLKYTRSMDSVHLRVEGELPEPTIDLVTRDLVEKMAILENAPCELVRL